jgi:Ca2+-binding EF-hand superfamily protein
MAATTAHAQSRARDMRFQGMDRNGDGVITRAEWNGSDRSFENNDWNGDGILSGSEVRPGARRPADASPVGTTGRGESFGDWTVAAFDDLDRNRDGRIVRREWPHDTDAFERADHNDDNVVTRAEFLSEDELASPRSPQLGAAAVRRFDQWDDNRDGRLSRGEWQGTQERFARLDRNRDAFVTRAEFGDEASSGVARTPAYRAGFERGTIEGRQAGREDYGRRRWDLEGQRELEQADSGYQPAHGSRADYHAGYRDGFR